MTKQLLFIFLFFVASANAQNPYSFSEVLSDTFLPVDHSKLFVVDVDSDGYKDVVSLGTYSIEEKTYGYGLGWQIATAYIPHGSGMLYKNTGVGEYKDAKHFNVTDIANASLIPYSTGISGVSNYILSGSFLSAGLGVLFDDPNVFFLKMQNDSLKTIVLPKIHLTVPNGMSFQSYYNTRDGYLTGWGYKYLFNRSTASLHLDGNGYLDYASCTDSSVWLIRNNGANNLSVYDSINLRYPISTVAEDLDGDGDSDLFVVYNKGIAGKVCINDGNGHFTIKPNTINTSADNKIFFADIDNDGDKDMLQTGTAFGLYVNDGTGVFTLSANNFLVPLKEGTAVFEDLDGDNFPELFMAGKNPNGSPSTFIYENNGGVFSMMLNHGIVDVYNDPAIAVFDANNDGDKDIFISGFSANGRVMKHYKNITHVVIPPVISYLDIPGSMCLGSTVNKTPASSGGALTRFTYIDTLEQTLNSQPKAVCSGLGVYVATNDSIMQYDLQGNLFYTYNSAVASIGLTNIKAIATDFNNDIYAVADNTMMGQYNTVVKINNDGSPNFTFNTSHTFTEPTAIAINPVTGFIYVADSGANTIVEIDPFNGSAGPISDALINKPVSLSFDKNGKLFVSNSGNNSIVTMAAGNVFSSFPLSFSFSGGKRLGSIAVDTTGDVYFSVQMGSANAVNIANSAGVVKEQLSVFSNSSNMPLAITREGLALPKIWTVTATGNHTINLRKVYYSIYPKLPTGLRYDFYTGSIVGTPIKATPFTTYTVHVENSLGGYDDQFSFSVEPNGPLSNTPGTNNAHAFQSDGLTVKYQSVNNCAEIASIEDQNGGTVLGYTNVTDSISPIAISFGTGKFVGRQFDINPEDKNAQARLKLYLSYQDVVNYNATNGSSQDLSNDTVARTMSVAVLQVHKNDDGTSEKIIHNPINAAWDTTNRRWEVDFQVNKFSTFLVSDLQEAILSQNCYERDTIDTLICSNSYIYYKNGPISQPGYYTDTLLIDGGCNLILTTHLAHKSVFNKTIYGAICTNDSVLFGNQYYHTAGTYSRNLLTVSGCDSVITLVLTQDTVPDVPTITLTGTVLYSSATHNNQWYVNGTPIAGAVNEQYTPTSNGAYTVKVSSACDTVSSIAYNYTINGLEEWHNEITIVPNPAKDIVRINGAGPNFTVVIYDQLGAEVIRQYNQASINVSGLAKGLYQLCYSRDSEKYFKKLMIE